MEISRNCDTLNTQILSHVWLNRRLNVSFGVAFVNEEWTGWLEKGVLDLVWGHPIHPSRDIYNAIAPVKQNQDISRYLCEV